MGDMEIKIVCHAYDPVLLAENDAEDDLRRLSFQLYKTAKTFDMTKSTAKTECITTSKTPIR